MKKLKKIALTLTAALTITALPGMESKAKTVEPGDTLSKIANQNGLSLNDIVSLNPQIKNIDLIFVGEEVNTIKKINNVMKQPINNANNEPAVNENVGAYNSNDVQLLAGLIQTEAGGESFEGKVAVGEVVMNRVRSSSFPSTVAGVIYQPGQFAAPGQVTSDSLRAAKVAMSKGNTGILYFYNPATATTDLGAYHTVVKTIGNHTFLR